MGILERNINELMCNRKRYERLSKKAQVMKGVLPSRYLSEGTCDSLFLKKCLFELDVDLQNVRNRIRNWLMNHEHRDTCGKKISGLVTQSVCFSDCEISNRMVSMCYCGVIYTKRQERSKYHEAITIADAKCE